MFNLLYPIVYIVCLSGLIAWFYFQDKSNWNSLLGKLFLGSLFAYLISLGFVEATVEYKLFVLFRDLFVMGFVALFFSFLKNNSLLFFGFLVAFYGLLASKGADVLEQTFPQSSSSAITKHSDIELDKNGELLLELKERYTIQDLQPLFDQYNITYQRAFHPASAQATTLDNYYVLDIPNSYEGQRLKELMQVLQESALIDWVEENEIIKIHPLEETATTPIANRQFGINDPELKQLWGFEAMNVDHLYKGLSKSKIRPKQKALIAILDTGVDAKHEDIAANFSSIKEKYNTDSRGHGTHCAGIAAAVSNNGVGIASFAPNNQFVQVTSIQVLSGFGIGTQRGIIDGMILAADNGAAVISMSLGGLANALKQKAYQDAVNYCNNKGAVIVVAAGNSNKDARNYTPANLNDVITVSALDQDLNKATFSNYVTHLKMGVAAPGVGIYSTIPGNKYAAFNGTSMATPYVSGLVGVLKSIRPELTTKEVFNILHQSGINTKATKETGRLIQPAKALEMVID